MSRLRFVRLCTPPFPLLALTLLGAHQSPGALQPVRLRSATGAFQAVDDSTRKDSLFPRVNLSPKQGPLLAQLARISQEARQRKLTPILDIGAWWCGPCHALDTVLATPAMRPDMQQMYVVHLEVDLWHDAMDSLKIAGGTIPRLVALDATGRPVTDIAPWGPTVDLSHGWSPTVLASMREYFAVAHTRFTSAASDSTATPKAP